MGTEPSSPGDAAAHLSPLETLLFECLRVPDPEQASELKRLCDEHPAHADALTRRFAVLEQLGLLAYGGGDHPGETLPRRFGPFRLLRRLGDGGMGVVYLAEQERLGRKVAVKLIRPEQLHFAGSRERFRREAIAVSRLDHPGICSVYDVGEVGDMPYIAMGYLEGETLAAKILKAGRAAPGSAPKLPLPHHAADEDRHPASGTTAERRHVMRVVHLVEQVARAVHAAHEADLVHRDLKPANIMVTRSGQPVVLDFGLARDESVPGRRLTRSGDVLGTPAYMAPEQIAPERDRPDRRTDVYALAVTLYEALTLRLPFDASTRESLYRQILSARPDPPTRFNRHVSRDLRVVIEKAIDRDPARRYATALELAEDLRRVRDFEPIRARPAGPFLRLRRWTQRNPVATTFLLLLALGLATSLFLLDRVRAEQRATQEAVIRFRAFNLASESTAALGANPLLALLLAREAVGLRPDLPETSSSLQAALAALHEKASLEGHGGRVQWVDVSPRGDIVTTSRTGTGRLWAADRDPRKPGQELPGATYSAVFSPSGDAIVSTGGNTACLWDRRGTLLAELTGHRRPVFLAVFSPAGDRILTCSADGTARLWSRAGEFLYELPSPEGIVHSCAFSPDGRRVATCVGYPYQAKDYPSFPVRIWDVATAKPRLIRKIDKHDDSILTVTFSPDSRLVLTASADNTARAFDLDGHQVLAIRHEAMVWHAVFSHDGKTILSCSEDETARLTDLSTGRAITLGHVHPVFFGCFSPDDRWICTAAGKGRIWNREGLLLATLSGHHGPLTRCAFAAAGTEVVTTSRDGTAKIWNAMNRDLPRLLGHRQRVAHAEFSPDGRREVLSESRGRTARVWDLTGEKKPQVFEHPHRLYFSRYDGAGQRFLTVGANDRAGVRVFMRQEDGSFKEDGIRYSDGSAGALSFGEFFTDGERFLTGMWMGEIRFRQIGRARSIHRTKVSGMLWSAAISPDERYVLVGADNRTVSLLVRGDNGRYRNAGVIARHEGVVYGVQFSRDGRAFLTASADKTARLWSFDGKRAAAQVVFRGHEQAVSSAVFSPDEQRVLTASLDRTARLWDLQGNLITILRGHEAGVLSARFSPDGREIVTASDDRTVRVWKGRLSDLEALADQRAFRDFTPAERARYAHLLADGETR